MIFLSLRFILGRAGSGKTTCCLDAIRRDLERAIEGKNLILLVPEQATFQNELELASTPFLNGIIRAQVLSFRRLAWHVLQEVGGGARIHIGDLGKHMVIRQFIENRKTELKIFSGASEQPGFVESLAGAISEFKLYQVQVKDLERILEEKSGEDSLLLSKLADLRLIYQDLEEYLLGRFIDPDDYLNLLAEKVHLSSTIINGEIWIDGFTGFTPQELKVIEALLGTAQRVNITLTLDSKASDVFNITRDTYNKISELALKKGVLIEKPLLLDQETPYRFQGSPALAHLEKFFFNLEVESFEEEAHDIKIISAQNHRVEVEAIAREIRKLCREQGYRFKDIAVILRDFANYDLLIETIFSDYDIPFFIDRKRTVMHHPLVELIRSALEVVEDGWSYQSVFRYLKTDLANVTRWEVDILENYCLAHGIKGKTWYNGRPWQYRKKHEASSTNELGENEKKELAYINKIRDRAIKELKGFYDKVIEAVTTKHVIQAVFQLLVDLDVPRKLEKWAELANDEGQLEMAREHNQIWDGIVDILDQMVETLGEQMINLESLRKVMDSGLESLKLGLIPPGLDHVMIGSLERSRNPNLKAVFVMGVGDGVLPARPLSEGLFNDFEREFLKDLGLELAPGTKEKIFDEEFLIYTALTRASQYLVLSYPLADSEGRALRPSLVIKRVKELFPKINELNIGVEPSGEVEIDLEFISHPQKALAFLGAKLRQAKEGQAIDPIWWDVYHWLLNDTRGRIGLEKVIEGLFHHNQTSPIDPILARKVFGNPLRVSVSRLEKFQSCPFSHFTSYALGLKEREVFKFTQPDLGQFFHVALEQFSKKLAERNLDWGQVDKKEVLDITNEIVENLIPQIQNEILLSSAKYRYLTKKFKKTIQRAALVLMEHARRGKFRPVGLEVAFGPQGQLPALKLTLDDGTEMELVGRIDRIDAARMDDKFLLRVIDYKSGAAGLSLLEVFYGFKLQLVAYLDIILTYAQHLLDAQDVLPAGVLYFYLKDPLINTSGPIDQDEIESIILKELKMQGLVLADVKVFRLMDSETKEGWSPIIPVAINKENNFYKNSQVASLEKIEILRNHIRQVLKQAGETILKGDVSISPYQLKGFKACNYCSFQIVCQFDPQVEGNSYRTMKPMDNEEIWTLLSGGENNDRLD